MSIAGNAINNNALAAMARQAGPQVTAAIRQASLKTGVDFAYLMEKAAAESSFKSSARAATSSASGLYQFIESTWLQMVERYGDKHGLGHYAAQIDTRGRVADPALRREILALRDDPALASLMAGEFASENRRSLIAAGIPAEDIGPTELYLAHFLGAGAASAFLTSMKENPLTPAADLFPRAAKANKNVFYNNTTQEARSLSSIYAHFDRKFSGAGDHGDDALTIASTVPLPGVKPARTPAATADNTIARHTGQRLDPQLMAWLNGERDHYHSMQARAIEALGTTPRATEGFIRPGGHFGTAGLAANPAEIMMAAALRTLPATIATRR